MKRRRMLGGAARSLALSVLAVGGLSAPAFAVSLPSADIECVVKSADIGSLTQGQDATINYTVTVRNNGPATAFGVTVSDTLSGDVAAAITGGAGCAPVGGANATCTVGVLGSGSSADVSVVVNATNPQPLQ